MAVKVLSVVGTRPQLVKAFVVSQRLREHHEEVLVHTGEQVDERLTTVLFDQLCLPDPDYDLSVGPCSDARQTARILTYLEDIVDHEQPDAVVVYGDSTTTLAGALATAKRPPTLVHVEAGLRSEDANDAREVNRVQADHAADVLCAPCPRAVDNLRAEGIEDGVHMTGDVMMEATRRVHTQAREQSTALDELGVEEGQYAIATVHRRENVESEQRLASILRGLTDASRPVVLPAHPRTVESIREYGLRRAIGDDVQVINPVGYLDLVRLVDGAGRVATDSGGIQREAFFLETPCATFREETEWVETVSSGWNVLVDADTESIRRELSRDHRPRDKPRPYGNGRAGSSVLQVIEGGPDAITSG